MKNILTCLLFFVIFNLTSFASDNTDLSDYRCIVKVERKQCILASGYGTLAKVSGHITVEKYDGEQQKIELFGDHDNFKPTKQSKSNYDGVKTAAFGVFYLGTLGIGPFLLEAGSDTHLCRKAKREFKKKVKVFTNELPKC